MTNATGSFIHQEGTACYYGPAFLHHLVAPAPRSQSFGTATSPQLGHPHEVCVSWPSEERWMNHSPVLPRYTAMSAFPSPSKSVGTAMSPPPGQPQLTWVRPSSEERWMNHSPVLRRYTAMSAFLSPS